MNYSTKWAINRLVEEYFSNNQLIIAFDFDDTFSEVVSLLKRCKSEINCKLILYTCRAIDSGKWSLKEALSICRANGIEPDSVNTDVIIDFQGLHHKVFYNILLDDRAGLSESCRILSEALNVINHLDEEHG